MYEYASKIKSLTKEIANYRLFLYHVFHYLNIFLPSWISKYVAKKDYRDIVGKVQGELFIRDKNGCFQLVHPDMALYGKNLCLMATPYPYAMEEYENPCFFYGNDINHLLPFLVPIDCQSKHLQGVHLSDPCIVNVDDIIYCFYRETIKSHNKILLKKYVIEVDCAKQKGNRQIIIESDKDLLLSPAFLYDKDCWRCYYVNNEKQSSQLILKMFQLVDFLCIKTKEIRIMNEPGGYCLWHIGVTYKVDKEKQYRNSDKLCGLFLYKHKTMNGTFKLFYSESTGREADWQIINEIHIPTDILNEMKFPYKSCFNPQNGKIILSFRDKKQRNRLVEL